MSKELSPSDVSFHTHRETGELYDLIFSKKWDETSLGVFDSWPETLKGFVRMILSLPTPAVVFWGPELIQIYNDPYAEIMGSRHPQYLGETFRECWPETYPTIYPWMKKVLENNEIIQMNEIRIPLTRHGFVEEAHFTFSLSPLKNDKNETAGVLQLVTEMTNSVLSERRKNTIRRLALRTTAEAKDFSRLLDILASNPNDISLALVYLLDETTGQLTLSGGFGAPLDGKELHRFTALAENILNADCHFSHSEVLTTGLPLKCSEDEKPKGVIILGMSANLRFDEKYQEFYEEIASEFSKELAAQKESLEKRFAEERLELSLQSGEMGAWDWDLKTDRVKWNDICYRLFGVEDHKVEMSGKLVKDCVLPEDREHVFKHVATSIENKNSDYEIQFRVRWPDGSVHWLLGRGKIFFNEAGEAYALRGINQDITQRKQVEDQFRAITELAPQFIWSSDDKGLITYSNPQLLDYMGVSQTELVGDSWVEKLHPDDRERVVAEWQKAIGTGLLYEIEFRIRSKSDEYGWFLSRAIPIREESGKISRWLGVSVDISDRKMAEEEHKQTSKILRSIMTSTSDIIYVKDRLSRMVYCNPITLKLLGRTEQETYGRNDVEFLGPGNGGEAVLLTDQRIMTTAQGETIEENITWPDGSKRVYMSLKEPHFDSRGNIIGVIGISRDITELKRVQLELSEAVRARDEFLSIASHELKTPITSLKLQLQMTQRSIIPEKNMSPTPEKLSKVLNITDRQILRLEGLVEDLLDVAKIRSGKLTLSPEEVSLTSLVREVVERFEEQFRESGIEVVLDLDHEVIGIWDRGRIEQVMVNLISNAIKYAPGKMLNISVKKTSGENASVAVKDHGHGISSEKQHLIFERFERATSSRNISGLGLGLFIVKQIVEAHNGTINLESELTKGSTFTVIIPLKPALTHDRNAVLDQATLRRGT